MSTANVPPQPAPPVFDVPEMVPPPLALPPLPTWPVQATDQQRADWFTLANLHQREAQRQTYWAASNLLPAAALQTSKDEGQALDRVTDAINALAAALAALKLPAVIGGGGVGGGVAAVQVGDALTMAGAQIASTVLRAAKGE